MEKQEILKSAIDNLIHADSFFCVTVIDGNLNLATLAKPEMISAMLLAVMRDQPAMANSINLAALGYAQEQAHNIAKRNQ